MGCDWIAAGDTCLGYSLTFHEVFGETRFETLESLLDEESLDDRLCQGVDDPAEQEKICEQENPHTALRVAWSSFLAKHHPELIESNILPVIGCTMKPGQYESIAYTSYCEVVFGYSLSIFKSVEKEGVVACELPTTFPVGMPEIITEFVAIFAEQEKGEPKKKSARRTDCGIRGPRVVSFVVSN